ncbi:unnamed protein product [Soboliphyme baturini]|uniref:Rho guanine nucleotide exchange factor 7 n=1 Tax=Soboliphyme baturini TaxID=241478 RepID=A0A183IU70_9BILA|nr:unnamed protein product [Soboliphyme baturini]
MNTAGSSSESDNVLIVRAKHTFRGRNNDELCFKKGDLIAVTQQPDGGWWEGTLNGNTGWFPANYVVAISADALERVVKNGIVADIGPLTVQENRAVYRNMILQDLMKSERQHLSDLELCMNSYLLPVKANHILKEENFETLIGNLPAIIRFQKEFVASLDEEVKKLDNERRIGGQFMNAAKTLKELLHDYCDNHPAAVSVMNINRDGLQKFLQSRNVTEMTLVTSLSRPFRHVEQYPDILLELERNLEETHPDRGDTQRSVYIFRDIIAFCTEVRKQKEMQLEIMESDISGWEGESINSLGRMLHMGMMSVVGDENQKDERLVMLFSSCLIVLQIDRKQNSYIFKVIAVACVGGKVPVADVCIRKETDGDEQKNLLVLQDRTSGKAVLKLSALSADSLNKWFEQFERYIDIVAEEECLLLSDGPSQYHVESNVSPLLKPKYSKMPTPSNAALVKSSEMKSVAGNSTDVPLSGHHSLPPKTFSGYCMRPLPSQGVAAAGVQVTTPNDPEEMVLLRVVEAYCSSASSKPSASAKDSDSPQLLIAEDEKIFVEEKIGDEVVVQEKTLVDTVYALKDQVATINESIKELMKVLQFEQKARKKIEENTRRFILSDRNTSCVSMSDACDGVHAAAVAVGVSAESVAK